MKMAEKCQRVLNSLRAQIPPCLSAPEQERKRERAATPWGEWAFPTGADVYR